MNKNKVAYCEWVFSVNGPFGMKLASSLGYEGVQLGDLGGSTTKFPFSDPRIQDGYMQASQDYDIELQVLNLYTLCRQGYMLHPINTSESDMAKESMKRAIDSCVDMHIHGIEVASFFAGEVRNECQINNFTAHLNYACDYAEDKGVQVIMESVLHVDTQLRILEATKDRVKVNFDTLNPTSFGSGDPLDEIRKLGIRRIDHIHLKDAPADFSTYTSIYTQFGEGIGRVYECTCLLKEIGYTGWYVTENRYENPNFPGTALDLAKKDCDYVKSFFV